MKKLLIAAAFLVVCSPAFAWNCSNPLAERVLVPSGTSGAYGDGDGQLASYNGQLYECEVVPPSTPSTGNTSSNSTSNSNSASSSQSNSNSSSSSKATGGNATGGNATGGNATGGNATANGGNAVANGGAGGQGGQGGAGGSVSNSGNSTNTIHNTNTNVAQGGAGGNANQHQNQGQSQTANGGNSSADASGNGVGNGNNSNDTTVNNPRQTATAISPEVLPTVPCFKGVGIGGQSAAFGFSFGGGKIDENCAELEAARQAPTRIARCKVYLLNKYVQKAGVTLADCMGEGDQLRAQIIQPAPVAPPEIVVNIPAPVVNVPMPIVNIAAPVAPAPPVRKPRPVVKIHPKPKACVPQACPPKLSSKVWTDEDVEGLNPAKQ